MSALPPVTVGGRFQFLGNHLQVSRNLGIIDMKNKNAAACRCANTRKPAQVIPAPTQRPLAAPHGILYDIPAFLVKGGFCRCVSVSVLHKSFRFLRCVGVSPARRFCFSPGARGGKRPRGAAVENDKGAGIHDISGKTGCSSNRFFDVWSSHFKWMHFETTIGKST